MGGIRYRRDPPPSLLGFREDIILLHLVIEGLIIDVERFGRFLFVPVEPL